MFVPVIPREVAAAIESFRSDGWTNERLIELLITCKEAHSNRHNVLHNYFRGTFKGFETLIVALVNGYEAEKTPEDMIRAYYEEQSRYLAKDFSGQHNTRYAVRYVLDVLRIKIEGVNV